MNITLVGVMLVFALGDGNPKTTLYESMEECTAVRNNTLRKINASPLEDAERGKHFSIGCVPIFKVTGTAGVLKNPKTEMVF